MLKILIACALVACILGQAHHNGTDEKNEHGTLEFFYDKTSHYMILRTHTMCYLWALDVSHQQSVHSPDGLMALEVQLTALSADKTKQTTVQATDVDHSAVSHCHRGSTIIKVTA